MNSTLFLRGFDWVVDGWCWGWFFEFCEVCVGKNYFRLDLSNYEMDGKEAMAVRDMNGRSCLNFWDSKFILDEIRVVICSHRARDECFDWISLSIESRIKLWLAKTRSQRVFTLLELLLDYYQLWLELTSSWSRQNQITLA